MLDKFSSSDEKPVSIDNLVSYGDSAMQKGGDIASPVTVPGPASGPYSVPTLSEGGSSTVRSARAPPSTNFLNLKENVYALVTCMLGQALCASLCAVLKRTVKVQCKVLKKYSNYSILEKFDLMRLMEQLQLGQAPGPPLWQHNVPSNS